MKYKLIISMLITAANQVSYAQNILTLVCQDSKNPNYKNIVYVDLVNKKVDLQGVNTILINDDVIKYEFQAGSNNYETTINRIDGTFAIRSRGEYNGNFGGVCTKKVGTQF